jgi:hypothetical protein
MPTPVRELVIAAAFARLEEVLPARVEDVTVERSRRAEPEPEERLPLVVVRARGELQPVPDLSAGDQVWAVEFGVDGWAGALDDLEAEQAVAELEAVVIEALLDQPLVRPDGTDLTTGVELVSSNASLFDAAENANPEGSFSATFRATVFVDPSRVSI